MKVDRRSFLGLGVGAVAGIAVSPVGMKLTDDLSIWTQNWSWIPVPKDGEVSYENSVCSLCPGGCGISVKKIENRPIKIEGRIDYPVNKGGACLHGIAGLQYLYGVSRIQSPLKKTEKGFEKISWQEAIEHTAQKLSQLRQQGSSEELLCIADKKQGSISGLLQHFMRTFGSPNFYTMQSLESYLELVVRNIHKKEATLGFDLQNSSFVLSFGANLLDGWGSPVNCFKANASKKSRKAKLYQIETYMSNTGANADKWIPIKPFAQADLALGICAVLLKNKLFDANAISNFQGGFAKLTAMLLNNYSPSKTAEITGVKASEIESLAIMFAKAKSPIAVFGRGRGDGSQSLKELSAVHLLNCLVNNINKKGGVFVSKKPNYLQFGNKSMDKTAYSGFRKPKKALYIHELVDNINKASNPLVKACLIYNANPCYSLHDSKSVKKAFEKIPFVVSFSSFFDETCQYADIIMPSHTFLERLEDVSSPPALVDNIAGLSNPIVSPIYDTKHPADIIILLSKALKGNIAQSFEWEDYESCFDEIIKSDVKNSLKSKGYAIVSKPSQQQNILVDVSYLVKNIRSIGDKKEIVQDFNNILIPIDNIRLPDSVYAASPYAIKTVSDKVLKKSYSLVQINPVTAKEYKLKDLSIAMLETPIGKAKVMINLNEGIMPDVLGLSEGLGHLFDDKYVSGKGVNVNDLIKPVIESGSKLDAAFGIKAKIKKV